MKIAVYKDNLSTGRGADKAVRNFADGLSERGHRVSLFEKPELEARINEAFDVFVATGSNEIVDLDHAGYFERPGRARVVLQLHLAPRGFFKWRHPFRNRAIRKAFNKADVIQILCSDYERELRAFAPNPRIFVIGNWIKASAPMENSPPGDSHVVLYPAASLNKIKNQKLLIWAFASIAEKHPKWKVRLLGKNTTRYADECRRLVRSLKMEGRIEMPGLVRDVVSEYSAASFVAFPSIRCQA